MGPVAARVHGDPSQHLRLVGVTGTNGKTTTCHLVESIAAAAGLVPAVVGTVGARVAGEEVPVARTTPEAADFQRLLARMVAAGVEVAAVEVSSHALALGRVAGSRFAVAAFTNLSQDHLDFHADMEDYFRAKASLFTPDLAARAVIWVDDPYGERLAGGHAAARGPCGPGRRGRGDGCRSGAAPRRLRLPPGAARRLRPGPPAPPRGLQRGQRLAGCGHCCGARHRPRYHRCRHRGAGQGPGPLRDRGDRKGLHGGRRLCPHSRRGGRRHRHGALPGRPRGGSSPSSGPEATATGPSAR